MQHTKTVAYLAALVVTTSLAVSHSSYATQILETLPTETVNKVYPARPTVKPTTKPLQILTGKREPLTEKARPATVVPQVNGGSDAFRLESMYVVRLLQKSDSDAIRTELGLSVKTTIKTFIDAHESLRQELEKSMKTETVMGKSVWNGKVNSIVDAYRDALKPYIATDKGEAFDGYIMLKRVLLQSQYEKARQNNMNPQKENTDKKIKSDDVNSTSKVLPVRPAVVAPRCTLMPSVGSKIPLCGDIKRDDSTSAISNTAAVKVDPTISCKVGSYAPYTFQKYYENLGRTIPANNKIKRYAIQWFAGHRDEFTVGKNDDDTKYPAERRAWAYFTDHNFKILECN